MKSRMASLFIAFSLNASAWGVEIIDQENIGLDWIAYVLDYPGDYMAQTFTVRNSGQLTRVAVQVALGGYSNYKPVTDDLLLRIMRTDSSGLPVMNEVLASQIINRHRVRPYWYDPPMVDVDLSTANLHVHAGEVLAIALSSNHTYYSYRRDYLHYDWFLNPYNPHQGGEMFVYSPTIFGATPFSRFNLVNPEITRDAGIRVFINVIPEPASIVLAAFAILGAVAARRPLVHSAFSAAGILTGAA